MISTGIVTLPLAKNQTLIRNGTVISDVYFYGGSPPVYPSPLGNGTGDWADSYASAAALVAKMTIEEKVSHNRVVFSIQEITLYRSVLQVGYGKVPVVTEIWLQYLVLVSLGFASKTLVMESAKQIM